MKEHVTPAFPFVTPAKAGAHDPQRSMLARGFLLSQE
jgi:hypothetical protein